MSSSEKEGTIPHESTYRWPSPLHNTMGLSAWLKTKPPLWSWTALDIWCPGDPPALDAAGRTEIWAIYMDEELWPEFHHIHRAWVSQYALDVQGGLCNCTKMRMCCMAPSAFATSAYRGVSRETSRQKGKWGNKVWHRGNNILKKATVKFPVALKARKHMQDELKRQVLTCREIQHLSAARLHRDPKRQ